MNRSRPDELLLSFLRTDPGGAEVAGAGALSSADWDDLLRTSALRGVTPLLYHRLTTCHNDVLIPAEVIRSLRNSYLHIAARNMRLYHELGRVLGRFRQDGIPVIVLKGAHLAEAVYGNIALRSMSDVDLLVHTEDLGRAEHALQEIGYSPMECTRQIAGDNHHFGYSLPNRGLSVEVHWTFLPSTLCFRIDMDGQWRRSRTAILGGVEVSVLCPEDLLLHLCVHASRHLFDIGLTPFCDISATIRHYGEDIDWHQIRVLGRQAGIANGVYLTLELARELLGAPVPEDVLNAIKPDDFDERFAAMAKGRIFAAGHRSVDGLVLRPYVAQLLGAKGFLNKTTLFLRRVFPSRKEMSRWYPASPDSVGIYFYYPARLRALLLRHGRQAWRLLRREKGMRGLAKQEVDIAPLRAWLMSAGGNPADHPGPERFPGDRSTHRE